MCSDDKLFSGKPSSLYIPQILEGRVPKLSKEKHDRKFYPNMQSEYVKSGIQLTENPQGSGSILKKSRKTLIIIIALLIIAALVAGVAALAATGIIDLSGKSASSPTVGTPTATTSAGANLSKASSLQYAVTMTGDSSGLTYAYSAKNIGMPTMMIRIDITDDSGKNNVAYIINGAQNKTWLLQSDGHWVDTSGTYANQMKNWNANFIGYRDNLASWTGNGDYTGTDKNGDSVRIHNIVVNPVLPDSLFEYSP